MRTESKFSVELVSLILSYTTVRDVVRWRRVSKWFQSITHDPEIWRALYMNAPFLRPRRPLPNNASLEDALLHSARLEHSWLTQPLRIVSHFQVPFDGHTSNNQGYKYMWIIGGKWLPICQGSRRLVLYEITADNSGDTCSPQILLEQEEEFSDWDYSVGTLEEGKWLVYILLFTEDPLRWKLLEIRVDAESGVPCDAIDLNLPVIHPKGFPVELNLGEKFRTRSPFLWIEAQSLVFDTCTRMFYRFPEFHITKPSIRSRVGSQEEEPIIVLTNTHIIALYYYEGPLDLKIVVQAFTIPHSQSTVEENNVLHLSHEGIYSYFLALRYPTAVIQNSIVDPVTGSTSVKLLERSRKYDGFHGICIRLTLHAPSAEEVAPITIKKSDLVISGNTPPYPIEDVSYYEIFHDICDEGYARGFFIQKPLEEKDGPRGIVKYKLDPTRDGCKAVLGQFSPVDLFSDQSLVSGYVSFDCVRGRICHDPEIEDSPGITVFDFE